MRRTRILSLLFSFGIVPMLPTLAQSADLSTRLYLKTSPMTGHATSAADATEVTGSIQAGLAPTTSLRATSPAVGHALAARARFGEVRAAADRVLLFRDDRLKSNRAEVGAAMSAFAEEMAAVERTTVPGSADLARKADALARDWYQSASSIINPPAGGLTAIAMPTTLARKADAASAALDRLIEDATARSAAMRRHARRPPSRPQTARPLAAAPASYFPQ